MADLTLQGSLKEAFAKEFSDTISQYASATSLFCDTLLQIVDTDIHAVNLTRFLNSDILGFRKFEDVKRFLANSDSNFIDTNQVEKTWLQYYLPRIYVFLHTTIFSGKRMDRDSISLLFDHLHESERVEASILKKSVDEGEKHLTFFAKACKDEDWYYNIDSVLDVVEENMAKKTRQNTIQLFQTIMKAIEPKFIDDLRANFGQRMSSSLMLGMNRSE